MRGGKGPDNPAWLRDSSLPLMEPLDVSWTGEREFHVLVDDWAGHKGSVVRVRWLASDGQDARASFQAWLLDNPVRRFATNLDGEPHESGWNFRTNSVVSWMIVPVAQQSHDV